MSDSLSRTLFYVAAAIISPAVVAAISCFSCANSDLNSMNEWDYAVYRSAPLAFDNRCFSEPEVLLNGRIDCPNGRCFTFLQAATSENYPEKVIRGCAERQFHNVGGLLRFARDPANRQPLSLHKWHECSIVTRNFQQGGQPAQGFSNALCFCDDSHYCNNINNDSMPNRASVPPRLPLVVLFLLCLSRCVG